MNGSTSSNLSTDNTYRPGESTHNPTPSKLKTYEFIIAIILGIGALAIAGAGVAGYFHVGALSNLAQIDAIIMMTVGGGGGVILLIVGIVKTVKNRQPKIVSENKDQLIVEKNDKKKNSRVQEEKSFERTFSYQPSNDVNSKHRSACQETGSTQKTGNISSVDTQRGLVYGPEMWPELGKKWKCELKILDEKIPNAPEEDVAEGRVRIYIPQKVSVNGKEKDFTLNNLIEMGGGPIKDYSKFVEEQFGNNTASGWIEIDRDVIPESQFKDYDTLKDMVEKKGCRMPSSLEAVVLNLMVFAFTDKRLYGERPLTFTMCSEKIYGKYPIFVGGFGLNGLCVYIGDSSYKSCGVAAVRKF